MGYYNKETVEILMEMNRLNKELFKTFVPKKTMKHMEVISNEMKEMFMESMCGFEATDGEEKSSDSKVKKVNIE